GHWTGTSLYVAMTLPLGPRKRGQSEAAAAGPETITPPMMSSHTSHAPDRISQSPLRILEKRRGERATPSAIILASYRVKPQGEPVGTVFSPWSTRSASRKARAERVPYNPPDPKGHRKQHYGRVFRMNLPFAGLGLTRSGVSLGVLA